MKIHLCLDPDDGALCRAHYGSASEETWNPTAATCFECLAAAIAFGKRCQRRMRELVKEDR